MEWYKQAQDFTVEIPTEQEVAPLKVLIFGVPGAPINEIGEILSDYYDRDLFNLERDYDDYWEDKYPTTYFDTGDKLKGSDSNHYVRDPDSDEKRRAIDRFLHIPNKQPEPLSYEDKIKIYGIPEGFIVTEVAEPTLVHWIKNGDGFVFFIDIDEKPAVDWLKERRKCLTCGNVHHMKENPPKHEEICDRCGSDLIVRPEDEPRNVRHQYNVWRQDFTDFKDQLEEAGQFERFDLEKMDLDKIVKRIIDRINSRYR